MATLLVVAVSFVIGDALAGSLPGRSCDRIDDLGTHPVADELRRRHETKAVWGELQRKVSSRLRGIESRKVPSMQPPVLEPLPPRPTPDGLVMVYVAVSVAGEAELQALERHGLRPEVVDEPSRLVQGAVPIGRVQEIAALPFVNAVRPIERPVVRTGAATSEGDALTGADQLRARGLSGSGIVVGVISDGIDHLSAAQATGDLPGVTVPADSRCRRGRGDEGVALLEIVHDVSPGARLLFSGPGSSLEMQQAVQCLVAAGADVIVDDLGFPAQPYFEDGSVAAAVRAAVEAGVSYHSAAGNDAEEHLQQQYRQSPSTTFHNFLGGLVDNTDGIVVPAFGTVECFLQWNDGFGHSANDYDLYILDQFLNIVASSVDVQVGSQDPLEFTGVVNVTSSPRVAYVVIDKFNGAGRLLKMFCFGGSIPEYSTSAGSIVGHPAVPGVVATGGVDAADPGLNDVEPFSSQGPVQIFFPTSETRQKPDIVAPDGVSISNAGGFPLCPPFCRFFGTSAAVPHSAGVAALLLEKNPRLGPADVQGALQRGAVDIGPPGLDGLSGFGRLDAARAADQVPVPACLTDPACDDGNPCTDDRCEGLGNCNHPVIPCADDGDVCNGVASCDPAAGCVTSPPLVCVDDEECTTDACVPETGCIFSPLAGLSGVDCQLEKLRRPDVCGAQLLDRKTRREIRRRTARAQRLVAKARRARTAKRFRARLRGIEKQLRLLRRKIAKAVGGRKTDPSCGETLGRIIFDGEQSVGGLRR